MFAFPPKLDNYLSQVLAPSWVGRYRDQLPVAVTYLGVQSVGHGKIEKVFKVGPRPIWKNLVINDYEVQPGRVAHPQTGRPETPD